MAKLRIPLPSKGEQVHRDRKSQYDRRRAKQVSLEGNTPCLRDLKMNLARENFNKGQISEKDFEEAIQRADKVCVSCDDPVCRFPSENTFVEIFIASDQPEVCRYCGKARTNFKEMAGRQLHTCPECGKSYWVEGE